ncbi:MAG: DMT family transporter [Thermoplasmata archaeon]
MAAVGPPRRDRRRASVEAAVSALLWASYYVFVLWLAPGTGTAAILVYPFAIGGLAFVAVAAAEGGLRTWAVLWADPASYLRIALVTGMQVATVEVTLQAGPIDSALLALIGDVIMVPVLLMAVFGEDRALGRSPWFLGGVTACLAGGSLTIVAGGAVEGIAGATLVWAPLLVTTIGGYFLLTARAGRRASLGALNGQAFLGAAAAVLALAPVLPGGASGLGIPSASSAALLVILGLTSFLAAPLLYFVAARRGSLVPVAMWMSLIPAFTALLTFLAFGVAPVPLAAAGVPIAIAGAFLALRGERAVEGSAAGPAQ